MLEVNFYNENEVEDAKLEFAVIASRYKDKWVYCKHRERTTWEVPGGHREQGETILETAKRELFEESGAVEFDLTPVCVYAVKSDVENFGMLYLANVTRLGELPHLEIEKIEFFEDIPEELTYPLIQPKLMKRVKEIL